MCDRKKTVSVCYVLSYYSPHYVRTETLIKALKEIKSIDLYQARNSSKGFWRYFETLWKLIVIRIFHNRLFYEHKIGELLDRKLVTTTTKQPKNVLG